MSTVSEKIAEWVEAAKYNDLPQEITHTAKRNILDLIGVTLAGLGQPVTEIVKKYLNAAEEPEQSTVIGLGVKTSCIEAAFANGLIGHCLDYDDFVVPMAGGGGPHISAAVLPAALAVAERGGNTGKEIITAYVLGCEIGYRIGRGVDPIHYNLGWHTTGTEGIFGATIAASKLLSLNREQITYALGITGSEASGLRENFGTMTKALHAGSACAKGVRAALLARLGFDSIKSIFEGKYGFCNVLSHDSRVDEITENMGQFLCLPEITLKLYPCCGGSHTAIHAVLELVKQHDINVGDIEELEVECDPQVLAVLVYDKPQTGLEGKFSLQFPLALALSEGRVILADFTDEKVKEPAMIALMEKVKANPNLELRSNEAQVRTVIVKVKLRDGRELVQRCDYRPGSPLNPFSDEEVIAKYRHCTSPVLSEKAIEESLKLIMNLDKLDNIGELLSLLGMRCK